MMLVFLLFALSLAIIVTFCSPSLSSPRSITTPHVPLLFVASCWNVDVLLLLKLKSTIMLVHAGSHIEALKYHCRWVTFDKLLLFAGLNELMVNVLMFGLMTSSQDTLKMGMSTPSPDASKLTQANLMLNCFVRNCDAMIVPFDKVEP